MLYFEKCYNNDIWKRNVQMDIYNIPFFNYEKQMIILNVNLSNNYNLYYKESRKLFLFTCYFKYVGIEPFK